MFCIIFFLVVLTEAGYGFHTQMDQASALVKFRLSKLRSDCDDFTNHNNYAYGTWEKEEANDDHLLKDGLPGQPSSVSFKQFAGNIGVDESTGRSLFYYFVESSSNSSMNPLILWLNGGPGCSSFGMGALTEIGPFGVNPDGKTLYPRQFSWNQVANVLFLEAPAGVGFSYSNTTSDYNLSGDRRTAADTYIFLMKWFQRYPKYKGRDFYLIGESYAGYYIPELAHIILENNKDTNSTPKINLQGIMIGNGLIDDASDTRGLIDFAWTHALVSDDTHEEFHQSCSGSIYENYACTEAFEKFITGIGNLDFLNIYGPICHPSTTNLTTGRHGDPCDLLYVRSYLNLPHIQAAINANLTKLPYPWEPCSHVMHLQWKDSPSSIFPIYKRLMGHGLRILLYSGDVDLCVPVTSSRHAVGRMGLKVIKPWQWWTISDTLEVAGYKVVYDGLTFVTVRGGGHEVSRSHPDRLYAILKEFLGK